MNNLLKWALLALLAFSPLSCKKDNPTPSGPDDGNEVPPGMVHLTGTVRDASGNPLSDVYLHIVYELDVPSAIDAQPMVPSSVTFFNLDQELHTSCDGNNPIPDGVMVKIFWDRDSDGPDDTDPPPPLCSDPPDCDNGPSRTVNLNEFPINGVAVDLGAGLFYMERAFTTLGDVLTPNRYYARIYCSSGEVLYESQVVDVPQGPSERELNFHCTDCNGIPTVPEWSLDQSYPNPATDSLTIPFGLQESARGVITLRWPDERYTETLTDSTFGSGAYELPFSFADRPNGLYTLRYVAGSYQNEHTVLKNVWDYDRLRSTDEADLTDASGMFAFDAAAGESIHLRDAEGTDQGTTALSRLTVVAIKTGYLIADSTFDITSGETYNLDLMLHPQ